MAVAAEIARVKRGEVLKGEAGIGKKRKDLAFDKAATEFLTWAEANKRPKTVYTYRQCMDQLKKTFSGKTVSQLNSFSLEKYKKTRAEAGAPVRANRELACLKALINRCKEWGLFEGDNPVTAVKFLKESQGQLRCLEPDEEARLLAVANEPLRSLIILGINTGLRIKAEALQLRWANVDLR